MAISKLQRLILGFQLQLTAFIVIICQNIIETHSTCHEQQPNMKTGP
jgi:hypothetical protein